MRTSGKNKGRALLYNRHKHKMRIHFNYSTVPRADMLSLLPSSYGSLLRTALYHSVVTYRVVCSFIIHYPLLDERVGITRMMFLYSSL